MAIDLKPDHTFDEFLLKPRGDKLIRINISRNTLIAFAVSILLHALLLISVLPKIQFDMPEASTPPPIEVSLAQPKQPEKIIEPPPQPLPEQIKEPVKKPVSKPKVMTQQAKPNVRPQFTVPEEMTTPKSNTPQPKEAAPTDMQSYIKQQQARRNNTDSDAARQNAEAVAKEIGPSEDEKRNQRIAKNLIGGAGGTFTLTSLSGRRATFSFNGWVNNLTNQKQQFFEVEANSGQDVRLLVVKKVISFIRESYPGDFPWESQRLGREITLSARLEDNSGLEEFLMKEFFDPK